MKSNYRESVISEDTEFSNCDFVNEDFTKTVMSEVVFMNVNFINCIFDKTVLMQTRFWACFFEGCTFKAVNFSTTYLGAWGGGQTNCTFIKCKLNKITDTSFLINSVFDNCKIKGVEFRTLYLCNVRFIGLLDDFSIRKFNSKEINQHQNSSNATLVKQKILSVKKDIFDQKKVVLENCDFSQTRLQFVDFLDCELTRCSFPIDNRHLYVQGNLPIIAENVYNDILANWNDKTTKSWALTSVENYKKKQSAVVCYYDFKHFEDDAFAEKLMKLFWKYADERNDELNSKNKFNPAGLFKFSNQGIYLRVESEHVNCLFQQLDKTKFEEVYNNMYSYLNFDFLPLQINDNVYYLSQLEQEQLIQSCITSSLYLLTVTGLPFVNTSLTPNNNCVIDSVIEIIEKKYRVDPDVCLGLGAKIMRKKLNEYEKQVNARKRYYNK